MIETAKHNGTNPYAYLHYLFKIVPVISDPVDWANLLPGNLDLKTVSSAFLDDLVRADGYFSRTNADPW